MPARFLEGAQCSSGGGAKGRPRPQGENHTVVRLEIVGPRDGVREGLTRGAEAPATGPDDDGRPPGAATEPALPGDWVTTRFFIGTSWGNRRYCHLGSSSSTPPKLPGFLISACLSQPQALIRPAYRNTYPGDRNGTPKGEGVLLCHTELLWNNEAQTHHPYTFSFE